MLRVFHTVVAKVDQDVTLVLHVCCKRISPTFHLFFRCMLLEVCLFGCCICFTHMLQVFYLDVTYVRNSFQGVFASVSDACFKYFICLRMYVARVVFGCFKSRSVVAYRMHVGSGRGASSPRAGARVWARETQAWAGAFWHGRGVQVRAGN
jgi:hypothetical protein